MSFRHHYRPVFILAITAATLGGTLGGTALVAQEPSAPPTEASEPTARLEAPAEPTHIGEVNRGDSPQATVVLHNRGNAPLTIEVGAADALRVLSSPTTILPGKNGQIVVEIDTLPADGESVWKLGMRTNDPAQPIYVALFGAKVKTWVVASPRELRWVTIKGEPKATLSTTFTALGPEPWSVKSVSSQQAGLDLEFAAGPATAEGKPSWILKATINTKAPLGAITGGILVELDHPHQKRLRLPISGFIRPAVTMALPDADYGQQSRAVIAEKPLAVRLRYFSERPLTIEKVTVTPPVFDAKVGPREDPRWGAILLTANDTTPEGEIKAEVTVKFDDPAVDSLTTTIRVELVP